MRLHQGTKVRVVMENSSGPLFAYMHGMNPLKDSATSLQGDIISEALLFDILHSTVLPRKEMRVNKAKSAALFLWAPFSLVCLYWEAHFYLFSCI